MSANTLRLALIGGDEPLAEAVLRLLEERDLEIGSVIPLAMEESDATVDYQGDSLPVMAVADFDWQQSDVVILASQSVRARQYALDAANAGRPVIGAALAEKGGADSIVSSGAALAIGRVLTKIGQSTGVSAVHASLSLPVSHLGKAGIEELSSQTRALFAMEATEAEVLPPRIAFNIVPQAAESRQQAASPYEAVVEADLRRLLAPAGPALTSLACWVPVFYGYAASLHVTTETPVDAGSLRSLLARAEGITVMDEPMPGGVPTPATDAQDSEDVFVGRLRIGGAGDQISLWLVFDGLRLEAAQIVALVENLIEKNQNSMLT